MASAVEADLRQLRVIFSIHRRMDPAIDTSEIIEEISERVREELDYEREARHIALYRRIFADEELVRVPAVVPELSTRRLLTMGWLEGAGCSPTGSTRSTTATGSPRPCSRPGGILSAITR